MSQAIKPTYGTSTAVTVSSAYTTLASSATAAWQSGVIDNTTNLFRDAHVTISATLASGSPANDQTIYIYAYGSEDGSTYDYPATGSEGALSSVLSPTNLRLIGSIPTPASGALTYKKVVSVAVAFGGTLPRKWGLVVRNYTGLAFTAGAISYTGVYDTVG